MSVANTPTPKRGGLHPIFGAFLGGSRMDETYHLVTPKFHCVSQLRTVKQLQAIQTSLEQARDSTTSLKFHGNLELDDLKTTTELDKKNFIKRVDRLVETYGLQGFFYMKALDGKMVSLLTHSHLFTLNDILQEHKNRASAHVPVLDSQGNETPESVVDGYSKYDLYDDLDCRISRLAVESLVGETLQADIETRYSHLSDFATLPGNVYFLMTLEASNASVALDIDDASSKFATLSLDSYPGENIKGLATEALRLIKVMEGGYCLPLRLGSDLLKKVCATSCEHFNRWMHAKLDEVRELELQYKLKDPKLMTNDTRYSSLGPVALCGYLQEKYGSLVTEKAWPALAATIPMSNHTPAPVPGDTRKCHYCHTVGHLRNNCPKLERRRRKALEQGGKSSDGDDTSPSTPSPFPAWRYIKPADIMSAIVDGEITYKWCDKCRCRATGKQGYYTTTHGTVDHIDKTVGFASTAAANHSSIMPLVPLADDSFLPDSIPDEEVLVFSGPWHTPIAVDVDCTQSATGSVDGFSPSMWLATFDVVSLEESDIVQDEVPLDSDHQSAVVSLAEPAVVHDDLPVDPESDPTSDGDPFPSEVTAVSSVPDCVPSVNFVHDVVSAEYSLTES
jgi:hypothetical protein